MRVLRIGAIIRHEQDDGVVVFARLPEVLEDPADAFIQHLDHRGTDFHLAGLEALVRIGEVVPVLVVVRARILQVQLDQSKGLHPARAVRFIAR